MSTNPATNESNLRRRTPRIVTDSNANIQQCAASWSATPVEVRAEWDLAAATLHDGLEPSQLARITGYLTYVRYNSVNLGVDNPMMDSPPQFEPVEPLPTIGLLASWTAAHGVKLMLTPSEPYAHKLEIWGARPLSPSRAVYTSTSFKKCGYINTFSGAVDVAPIYLTRYRVPVAGYKIALKVYGVTPQGQKTNGLTLIEIAFTPGAAQLEKPAEEEHTLHVG